MQVKIFNIQHFSTHDGPGIRSVIFFKGCNLSCRWCHNPESLSYNTELMFYEDKCIECGNCFDICKYNNHILNENGTHVINSLNCQKCYDCVDNCYSNALVKVGEEVSIDYLINEIISHKSYFDNSNGGVTFSGGECMLQIEPLLELLKRCKENDIHTAIDTAGNVDYTFFEKVIPYTDLFLYDIKAIDDKLHRQISGVSNDRIIENIKKLISQGINVHVKVPYIPNYNDVDMQSIGEFLSNYNIRKSLLPYHTFGESKYKALGIESIDQESISKNNAKYNEIKDKYNYE